MRWSISLLHNSHSTPTQGTKTINPQTSTWVELINSTSLFCTELRRLKVLIYTFILEAAVFHDYEIIGSRYAVLSISVSSLYVKPSA